MKTIDLKKILKPLYTASGTKPAMIDVPAISCLMVDGRGDPRRAAPEKLKTIIRHPIAKTRA